MNVSLTGCFAQPLGSYLKALAVLRLVAEQADSRARGWWGETNFHLDSILDEDGLLAFFLEHYQPTPILAPWNGGSGFYAKDRKVGIDAIAGSEAKRFALYREAIGTAREIDEVAHAKGASKGEEDDRRVAILLACRNRLPDAAIEWLDAAIGLSADGSRAFAPILGTGGNEGRLDYTNNFMEKLTDLLIAPDSKRPVRDLLRNALFGVESGGYDDGSVGQYDPGRAGGPNQGASLSNPWNFVLTLEGAVSWASGLYRRQGVSFRPYLCSPFTVRASAVGYGSAAKKDEDAARAEIWTPLWVRPTRYGEVKALLREGRAAIGNRPAETGLEFAQAVSMLQVDRGIASFVRYSLLKRRGDSYVALPAGRFEAGYRENVDLLREIPGALRPCDIAFRDKPVYPDLRRQIDEAVYDALLRNTGDDGLRDTAAAIGRLNRWVMTKHKTGRPRSGLSAEWVQKLRGTPEGRIAAALAGIWDKENPGIHANLDQTSNEFAWTGQGLGGRLYSVLERRVMSSNAREAKTNPVASRSRAQLGDVERFLDFDVDEDLIEDLLFCFLMTPSKTWTDGKGDEVAMVWPVYALLKHLFLPHALPSGDENVRLRGDLTVLSLLRAGDTGSAAKLAVARMRAAGLAPLEAEYDGGIDGERLAAALLIPVAFGPRQYRLVRRYDLKQKENL